MSWPDPTVEGSQPAPRTAPGTTAAAPAIGLGVIGASRFAAFCLESYQGLAGLTPRGIWSRTPARAVAMAEPRGLVTYPHLAEMLADPAIQVVHVASAPAAHARQVIAALEAGKWVMCEKPLATSLADAHRMLAASADDPRRLGINFMMRHGPFWRPIAELIANRALGEVLHAQLTNCAGDSGLPRDHWFWDRHTSGGIFVEHGVHFFDLLGSWLGPGRAISAFQVPRRGSGQVDQVGATVRYSGTTATFYHGFHQPPALDRQELRLVFELGELRLSGWVAGTLNLHAAVSQARATRILELMPPPELIRQRPLPAGARQASHRCPGDEPEQELQVHWSAPGTAQQLYAAAVRDRMSDFLAGLADREHLPRVSAIDGLQSLATALAADELARAGAR